MSAQSSNRFASSVRPDTAAAMERLAASSVVERPWRISTDLLFRILQNSRSPTNRFANAGSVRLSSIIISEYGGIAFNNDDSGWGYGNKVNTKEDFIRRFDEITTAVKELPYCCGFCYTQVSDVQQEINGLMDMERNFKVDPKVIKEINERKVGYWRSYM